jgi:hypothetical protein
MRTFQISIHSAALTALIAASPLPALAADAAGLVLEVSGKTEPSLAAYAEVTADQAIKLDAGATLKVVHYKSCRVVTLSGGTLKVDATDFDLSGGKVDADRKSACPRRIASRASRAGDAGTGGIVMRGAGDATVAVGPAETFVLAGGKLENVKTVRLLRDEKVVAEWKPGHTRSWTAPKNSLKVGDAATLVFVMKGKNPAVEQQIKVLEDAHSTGEPKMTVIRLD